MIKSFDQFINETSTDFLRRAARKAYSERKTADSSILRKKRNSQYYNFKNEIKKREAAERNAVCPKVYISDLKKLPKNDTYLIMNCEGKDMAGNFIYDYSGRAGTKEQCREFIDKFYEKNEDWDFFPTIISLEQFLEKYSKKYNVFLH